MPRKSKSAAAFDIDAACMLLIELGVKRKQFIKAKIRVMNAAGALVRRALGWQASLSEAERGKLTRQAVRILAADDPATLPDDLAVVARALADDIQTSRTMAAPGEVHQHQIELQMKRIVRQFPVWAWAKEIKGFSALGLAIVISEAGRLDNYPTHSKLWKRLGLSPITKDGETRACSTWRKKGGLTADDWKDVSAFGPKYSPKRRAAIFSQVGNPIIGGMGKGYRPEIGEDIDENSKLSHYEKVFVRRLRYEAERDEAMRRPDTDAGKESYSKYCAMRAQRYTEKRLLRDLWRAWRRAVKPVSEKTDGGLPDALIADAPQGAVEAYSIVPQKATSGLPPPLITDAPQGAGEAVVLVPDQAVCHLPPHQSRDAA